MVQAFELTPKPTTNLTVSTTPNSIISRARHWSNAGDVYWSSAETVSNLPSGIYYCGNHQSYGPVLVRHDVVTDNLIHFPQHPITNAIDEIEKFWNMQEVYKENGFIHKRGILFTGPPGCGKTSAIFQLSKRLIQAHNAIVMYANHPGLANSCIQLVKKLEPDRAIIVIFEDFDILLDNGTITDFLSLMDGDATCNNVVFICTTNRPEAIDTRFLDRPSRIDLVVHVGYPTPDIREAYFKAKLPNDSIDLVANLTRHTEDFSFGHLREMIILTKIYNLSPDAAATRLRKVREDYNLKLEQFVPAEERQSLGFGT